MCFAWTGSEPEERCGVRPLPARIMQDRISHTCHRACIVYQAYCFNNRRGHYQRALEEAVQSHTSQWPLIWNGKNPLHGGGNFNNMGPEQRVWASFSILFLLSLTLLPKLALLKALIIWSLSSSEAIQAILKESYKQQRHDDDLNQPLSVQPWGRDGDKRRYWLIEGQDDTHFRLYRESNPVLKNNTWRALAGSIDELKLVADRLEEEGSQASRRLKERIVLAVPRFEASEEVSPWAPNLGIHRFFKKQLTRHRNANDVITAIHERHNLPVLNLDSPSTKVVPVANGSGTTIPTRKKWDLMRSQQNAQTDRQAYQPRLSQPGLPSLPVDVRSGREWVELMARPC